MTSKLRQLNQKGFTIVELLVATAVLSVILLIVTMVMVGIGNLYYKGVNQARVQDNVRSLTDEISQALQLDDGTTFAKQRPVAPQVVGRVCINNVRYSYVLNKQIGSTDVETGDTVQHVLWRDKVTAGTCSLLTDFWKNDPNTIAGHGTDGVELIAPHSRLTSFDVDRADADSPYVIKIGVAYGDGDLLCNESVVGDCDSTEDETLPAHATHHTNLQIDYTHSPYEIICRGHLGDQFCATSALQTTVIKRLIKQG
jgi:prepilin-type N-terminal cleavage/methylation domain-containing protein